MERVKSCGSCAFSYTGTFQKAQSTDKKHEHSVFDSAKLVVCKNPDSDHLFHILFPKHMCNDWCEKL